MIYPFMILEDNTEFVHSEMKEDGSVKVYMERPDAKDCFHHATCWLPDYRWEDIYGFTHEEIDHFDEYIHSLAHNIIKLSQKRNADNL